MILSNNKESQNGLFKGACVQQLIQLWEINSAEYETLREIDESKKGRNLDFYIVPGAAVLRFPLENNKIYRNEIRVVAPSGEAWQRVVSIFAESPLLLAYLAGDIERRSWMVSAMDQIVAKMLTDISEFTVKPKFLENDEELTRRNDRALMLVFKTFKKIEADPLAVLSLFGKIIEELMAEYKESRYQILAKQVTNSAIAEDHEAKGAVTTAPAAVTAPARLAAEVKELKFPLKADELPGLVLRRFDPIPVPGSEEAVEKLIEEAYDRISRRAQIRGLAFR